MSTAFYSHCLPHHVLRLVELFQSRPPLFLQKFYLSGGTALALQLGHRESQDLDFFSPQSFSPLALEQELKSLGQLSETELADGTVNTFVGEVKVQFLKYPYPHLDPLVDFRSISISSIRDVACTKLQTIGARGYKKDFIDLYFLFEQYSLSELLDAVEKKYSGHQYNQVHILKSLVYFEDAEQQPMPRMFKHVSWDEIKQRMIQEVKSISF